MRKSMKLLFYLKHLMLMSTVNKVRLVLTSIGIFIAVFLFSSGLIITNSYYSGCLRIVENMDDNTTIISSNKTSEEVKEDISSITTCTSNDTLVISEKKAILSTKINNTQYLTVMASIQGVSNINKTVSVITDDEEYLPIKTELLKGRLISQTDIQSQKNVVVIDSFTETLLFPDGNSIGNYIDLGTGINGATVASDLNNDVHKFEVIGVVQESYLASTRKMLLKKSLTQNDENIFVHTSIYCPISTIKKLYPDSDCEQYYIYSFENHDDYKSFNDSMHTLSEISERKNESYTVSTKESQLLKVEQNLSYTKTLLNLISLVLCLISGISIMSITFFSVKERIPEIGIRKAFGASKIDIVFQFVFELVFISFIVSIFSVCISFLFCKLIEGFLSSQLFMAFTVSVSIHQLLLPVLVGVLEAMLCSIIPSFYASNIKVTSSLRFE